MSNQLFNTDIEEAILGAICLEPSNTASAALSILKEDAFYKNENKLVFRAINILFKEECNIDTITVTNKLKSLKVLELGGNNAGYYVSKLTDRIASSANIEYHCRLLYQYYLLRELKKLSLNIENRVNESGVDCFEVISEIEKTIQDMTSFSTNKTRHIKEIHSQLVSETKDVLNGNKSTGILSGIKNLDNQTGGWQNGNLIVIAARPGMGKSAFALQLAKYPSSKGTPVAILSLEMQDLELGSRLFASETYLNNTKINQKKLNAEELHTLETGCDDLLKTEIYIDDSPSLKITHLKNKARRLYYDKGIRLLIIDYLQLMDGEGFNREQEIAGITRGLKGLAKELNIPIIVLSQLSRKCEDRGGDKRPALSDLRESGAIEQDADIVIFLWAPAYYELYTGIGEGYQYGNNLLQAVEKNNDIEICRLLMIDIAKGRGLRIGEVPTRFFADKMIITNLDLPETNTVKELPQDSKEAF